MTRFIAGHYTRRAARRRDSSVRPPRSSQQRNMTVPSILALTMLSCVFLQVMSAEAAGTIHFRQGYSVEAERWGTTSDGVFWYERNGLRQLVPKEDVLRTEGGPTPRTSRPTPDPVGSGKASGPSRYIVQGTFTLYSQNLMSYGLILCAGSGGYSDIQAGTQVVVKDEDGGLLGVGSLEDGYQPGGGSICRFKFKVKDVPEARFYRVQVSRRGELIYSLAQMKERGWLLEVSLGP
jgi:hypothetical protein